jgi:uncharacterized protein (TIGR03083 family)
MDTVTMVSLVAIESQRLADAATGSLDAAIEHCPGWTMRDLVTHVGDVQWFWSEIVEQRAIERSAVTATRPEGRADDCVAWFRSQATRLVAALSAVDNPTPLWTWWPPSQNAAFVKRRQLLEVAVHGWDARIAIGRPSAMTAISPNSASLNSWKSCMICALIIRSLPRYASLRPTQPGPPRCSRAPRALR